MVEVMLFVNIGLLVIGSVTLTIAVLVVLRARGYVELAERRLERLREGQERLFIFLREERRFRNEGEQQHEYPVQDVRSRGEERSFERIARLEWEIQDLRRAAQKGANLEKYGGNTSAPGENVALIDEEKPMGDLWCGSIPSAAGKSKNEPHSGRATEPPTVKSSGFAVGHAHPDDDISLRRTNPKAKGSRNGAQVKMFLEHYHRYLENYEGYVKLAERLYRMREAGEAPTGSPAEREWEQRLRRLQDGIQRTTARLDILEQYNPELASDERVSHRAEIARSYSELEGKLASLRVPKPFLS